MPSKGRITYNNRLDFTDQDNSLPRPARDIWLELTWCPGEKNSIPMPRLAALVGLSTRQLQDEIKLLIEKHGKPIGSSSAKNCHGYYVITDQADRDHTVRNLDNRIISLAARRRALCTNPALETIFGQLELQLGGEKSPLSRGVDAPADGVCLPPLAKGDRGGFANA